MKKLLLLLTITLVTSNAFAATEADVIAKAKTFDMGCSDENEITVEKVVNKYKYEYEKPTDPDREAVFFIATCLSGAYNTSSVMFFDNPYADVQAVPLSIPLTNKKSKVIGLIATHVVGGITFDAKTKTLVSFSKGRGLGDLSTTATYQIYQDMVVLRKYEEDNTPDEKFNPKVIFVSKEPLKL